MSFDGIFTHAMIQEIQKKIKAGRLSKIQQPFENELILTFRSQATNFKLLLSAHPNYARIQFTEVKYDNPSQAPAFCMTLRKYLEGALLEDICQEENDRIVSFYFRRRNDLGDLENIVLICELMGRHSAIILLNKDSGKIIDCLKHVGPSQNSYRTLLPGAHYIAPPKQVDQANPFLLADRQLFAYLSTASDLDAAQLQKDFQGMGRDSANELAFRLAEKPNEKLKTWRLFFNQIDQQTQATWSTYENKEYFTAIPYHSLGNNRQSFPSLSQLLDEFYAGKANRDRVKQQAGDLIKLVEADLKKNHKRVLNLTKDLAETENAEEYRRKGELLTTYLHQVTSGMPSISLPNYYEEEQPLKIDLRVDLSPAQNAQKYFQKYNKLKNGVHSIQQQIEKSQQEILYLETVLNQLELATPADIQGIREELIAGNYLRERQKNKQKRKQTKQQPAKYLAEDGTIILVGKNNLQNDQLTLKTANKNHIWLHAKDIPGSHVIIQSAQPSQATLLLAAQLAAYFSKFRLSSSVPVDYVAVKHVKKPNGAKPGFVIYEQQRTLFVTPDETTIKRYEQ